MLRSARSGRRAGFTLMELLVVLAILVLLAAMVAPRILGLQGKADIKAAQTQISLFEGALEGYAVECGGYPTTEQGLQALISPPAASAGMGMGTGMSTDMGMGMDMGAGAAPGVSPDLGAGPDMGMGTGMSTAPTASAMQPSGAVASRWDGPYLNTDTVPVDPWGMPYGYAYPPTRGAGPKPDIWSFGPDNQDGTEDDIVNWSRAATGAGQMPGQMPGQEGMTSEQLGGGLGPDAMPGPPPIDQGMPPMGQGMPPMGQGMPPMGQDMPPMQPMTPPAQPMTQPAMP
ncbi:MAG: type II secretion system protein GspG [Pirellulales bacterium]|jgi:prepilin-type N-terminal cleavage/methylation domain-containing protein|nr:type II secretion system protein GspG [Pirellulales bacterium]NLZ00459.1 prepilin-type N-terminal cleavage/methylation domain-containing protein [Pirellulaceae bacterium]